MTDPSGYGSGSELSFNAPLSEERANRLVDQCGSYEPATVLDVGCGWGELLLRILARVPDARGVGVDIFADDLVRARAGAAARGLAERVSFVEGRAGQGRDGSDAAGDDLESTDPKSADLVVSIGAYQAFGTIPEALAALRGTVAPGGRLLFGAEFWERPPTDDQLAHMWPGTTAAECLTLADIADEAVAAGFGLLSVQTSTRGEWEEFESGYLRGPELWLLTNPGHPEAAAVRAKLDKHRSIWLRGHRDVMGFAYLTLGVGGGSA